MKVLPNATINTESPAWAIDRLSILILKIYHMQQEVDRSDATPEHKGKCEEKLRILLEQKRIYAWHWISYWQISVLDVNI